MKYDFTTLRDRTHAASMKWERMKELKKDIPAGTIPFSVADMEFINAPEIIDAIKDYLDNVNLGYTIPSDKYYQTVCTWMKEMHDYDVNPHEIVTTPGVVPALYYCTDVYSNDGDGVIIMPPVYPPFYDATKRDTRKTVLCPLILENDQYYIDFTLLEEFCKKRENTLLIFCNPHNPGGRIWSKDELYKVAKICYDNNVFLISDEIHCDITMPNYTHFSMGRFKEFEDNLVVCTAPTKTFNTASTQMSNLIIKNEEKRQKFIDYKTTHCIEVGNSLGFAACIAAYTKGHEWRKEMLSVVWDNYLYIKDFIEKNLPSIGLFEMQGTYLAWIDCRKLGVDHDTLIAKMEEHNLFFGTGTMFGPEGAGFLRMVLATPKHAVIDAMNTFKTAIEELM